MDGPTKSTTTNILRADEQTARIVPPPKDVLPSQHLKDLELAWPPAAQWGVAILLIVSAALLLVHVVGLTSWGTHPATVQHGQPVMVRLDLNHASAAELMQVPGIGPTLAERIVQHRRTHGPFQHVKELVQVKRIGPATLERIKLWVYTERDKTSAAEPLQAKANDKQPAWQFAMPRAKLKPGEKINVNTAAVEMLQRLPRIGPTLSQRIVAERQKRRFISVDDLRRVRGIGQKTMEHIRPYVTVK